MTLRDHPRHRCRGIGEDGVVTTLAFVHAHPDDEALFTAGTMARAVAEGHRVVLITATDGAAGLANSSFSKGLAEHRSKELQESARILKVAALHGLGYPDSGLTGHVSEGFAHQPVAEIAERIVDIAHSEAVDVLVGYDAAGGYGHPDHVHVHRCTHAAAQLLGPGVRLFEATLPREPIASAVTAAARLHLTPAGFDPSQFARAFTPRRQITHRVDVRRFLHAKRASMRAHASQATADDGTRTLAVLSNLPGPLFSALLGTEYYVRIN